jgi:hypothetical protein
LGSFQDCLQVWLLVHHLPPLAQAPGNDHGRHSTSNGQSSNITVAVASSSLTQQTANCLMQQQQRAQLAE